jgi:hypothetical protein
MNDEIDELDAYLGREEEPTDAENVKMGHVMMEKASINPERRKILRAVGIFGKSEVELKNESELSDFLFKFHLDFLLKGNFLRLEDGKYRLTDLGIALHDSVC